MSTVVSAGKHTTFARLGRAVTAGSGLQLGLGVQVWNVRGGRGTGRFLCSVSVGVRDPVHD